MQKRRAIISVYEKAGIVPFALRLVQLDWEILSTGGTSKLLKEAEVPHIEVAEYTGFPEGMDGRIKTLHPRIFAGILARRHLQGDLDFLTDNKIGDIDLVVCNLYPFRQVVEKGGSFADVIEMIDVGGPSMIRAAGKNHRDVTVIVDPADYSRVCDYLAPDQSIPTRLSRELALKVFRTTAEFDTDVARYLEAHLDDE